jgi:hypothetical protein
VPAAVASAAIVPAAVRSAPGRIDPPSGVRAAAFACSRPPPRTAFVRASPSGVTTTAAVLRTDAVTPLAAVARPCAPLSRAVPVVATAISTPVATCSRRRRPRSSLAGRPVTPRASSRIVTARVAPAFVPVRPGTLIASGTSGLTTLRATALGVARAPLTVTPPGTTAAVTTAGRLPCSVSTLTPRSAALAVSRDRPAITEPATTVVPAVATPSCIEARPAVASVARAAEPVAIRPVPVEPSASLSAGGALRATVTRRTTPWTITPGSLARVSTLARTAVSRSVAERIRASRTVAGSTGAGPSAASIVVFAPAGPWCTTAIGTRRSSSTAPVPRATGTTGVGSTPCVVAVRAAGTVIVSCHAAILPYRGGRVVVCAPFEEALNAKWPPIAGRPLA